MALANVGRDPWTVAMATLVSYGLVLAVLFALLFVVPYVVAAAVF